MKFMIPILPLLLMSILFGAPSHARENNFPIDDCDSLFKGVKFLVGEADKNWTALGKKSEGPSSKPPTRPITIPYRISEKIIIVSI